MTERRDEVHRNAGEFCSSLMDACKEGKTRFPCCGVSVGEGEESSSREEILNNMREFCFSLIETCKEGKGGFPCCGTPTGEDA